MVVSGCTGNGFGCDNLERNLAGPHRQVDVVGIVGRPTTSDLGRAFVNGEAQDERRPQLEIGGWSSVDATPRSEVVNQGRRSCSHLVGVVDRFQRCEQDDAAIVHRMLER
jgi:hypothetical protein